MFRGVAAILLASIILIAQPGGMAISKDDSASKALAGMGEAGHWLIENGRFDRFFGVDNIPVHYVSAEPKDATKALVFLNGRTETYAKYAEALYDLRLSGMALYAMDHRGQGFSGRMLDDSEKGYVVNRSDYSDDLATFLNSVVRARPYEKVYILAHSMGGGIAIYSILKNNVQVDGLILSSPMIKIETGAVPEIVWRSIVWFLGSLLAQGEMYVPSLGRYGNIEYEGNPYTNDENRLNQMNALFTNNPAIRIGGPTVHWIREMIAMGDEILAQAGTVDVPMKILQAGEEEVVGVAANKKFCDEAPDCSIEIFDGAKHELLMEKDETRDSVIAEILAFTNN